jgi:hypothetical protein
VNSRILPQAKVAFVVAAAAMFVGCASIAGLDSLQLVTDKPTEDETAGAGGEGTGGSGGTAGAAGQSGAAGSAGAAGTAGAAGASGGAGSAGGAGAAGSAGASGAAGGAGAAGSAGAAGGSGAAGTAGAAGASSMSFSDFWQVPACVACLSDKCAAEDTACGDTAVAGSPCKTSLNCIAAAYSAQQGAGKPADANCAINSCIGTAAAEPKAAFMCMATSCASECGVAQDFPCPTAAPQF